MYFDLACKELKTFSLGANTSLLWRVVGFAVLMGWGIVASAQGTVKALKSESSGEAVMFASVTLKEPPTGFPATWRGTTA